MADGPHKPAFNSRGCADTVTGALLVKFNANSGSDRPLTNAGNLAVRVDDATGYLLVTQK